MPNDPYVALGLAKTATAADIKKAYRKLVRTSHPDLNPDDAGAEARFKEITAAYEILKDTETRTRFDAGEIDGLGAERAQRQYYRDFAGGPVNAYQNREGFGSNADPADIFAEILRNRARGGAGGFQSPGAHARYSLEVPFLEAAKGTKTTITLPDGQSLSVAIPRGTEDGQTLRLRGKGAAGFGGGPTGDALITVLVRPHSIFQREGNDILITLPISFDEAILGGKVTAPTIDGSVQVTIPANASPGQILRLRGRGIERAGTKIKGDQKIELKIVVPPADNQSLRAFLSEWRKTQSFEPRADFMKEVVA
ncbi:DnaJ C-terminal domain-containing protein [Planktotalea arctica]|uniref:DnaJ C-terminal domain-containing protein n=1 Tax=Planktotalea arctica TaxID=1481893 RepID=UPI000A16DA31|nr:J domain-containing protein [Planktotalea arctica]